MARDSYHITDQHGTYFLTSTVVNWIDLFSRKEYRDILVDGLNFGVRKKGLILHAWVIMTNHIHLVARCEPPHRLSDFLRDFKSFTSKQMAVAIEELPESRKKWMLNQFAYTAKVTHRAENYKIWQDGNHPVDLQHIDVWQKINYIHENPVRAGWVDYPHEYLYSSARDYNGQKGLVEVSVL